MQEEDGVVGREMWICHTETGRMCFAERTTNIVSFIAWLNMETIDASTIGFFALTHHADKNLHFSLIVISKVTSVFP